MSETATTATTAAVNRAAAKAGVAAAAVSEALPTVVETTEVALELPVKVVLNQRFVVIVTAAAAAAAGAGAFYGIQKWRNRKSTVITVPNTIEDAKPADA